MNTFESVQSAIYARLDTAMSAAYPEMLVEYENRGTVDLAEQTEMFMTCDLVFNDGQQMAMGEDPLTRQFGAIWLSVWTKAGGGTLPARALMSYLTALFGTKRFGGLQTQAARPLPKPEEKGWNIQTLRIPFYFDQIPGS